MQLFPPYLCLLLQSLTCLRLNYHLLQASIFPIIRHFPAQIKLLSKIQQREVLFIQFRQPSLRNQKREKQTEAEANHYEGIRNEEELCP